MPQDLLRGHTRRLRHDRAQILCAAAEQRERVHICQQLHAVVRRAVHVDGDRRDDHEVPVDIRQPRLQLPVPLDDDPSRDGQRPVEPRVHQHPAVLFRVQHGAARAELFRVLLDLERRAVAVRGGQREARDPALRHAERQQRRIVPRHDIPPAGADVPRRVLRKRCIPLRRQSVFQVGRCVIAARAFFNQIHQLFCILIHDVAPRFVVPPAYHAPQSFSIDKISPAVCSARTNCGTIFKTDHNRRNF